MPKALRPLRPLRPLNPPAGVADMEGEPLLGTPFGSFGMRGRRGRHAHVKREATEESEGSHRSRGPRFSIYGPSRLPRLEPI